MHPGKGADLVNHAYRNVPAVEGNVVSVAACGICGGDPRAWSGEAAYGVMPPSLPPIPGHDFKGQGLVDADAAAAEGFALACDRQR